MAGSDGTVILPMESTELAFELYLEWPGGSGLSCTSRMEDGQPTVGLDVRSPAEACLWCTEIICSGIICIALSLDLQRQCLRTGVADSVMHILPQVHIE